MSLQATSIQENAFTKATCMPTMLMAKKKTTSLHFISLLFFNILFAPGSRFDVIAPLPIPNLWMPCAHAWFVEMTFLALLHILSLLKRQTRRLYVSYLYEIKGSL
jgi:hypothetical protein